MAFVSGYGISVIIKDVLTCRPLSKAWNPLKPGVCEHTLQSLIALTTLNMVGDLFIILLPMPMIWSLQMAKRRKIELTIVFALGVMYAPPYTTACTMELILMNTAFASSLSSARSCLRR